MGTTRWFRVAAGTELAVGDGKAVTVGERRLAVFNDGGEWFAIDDVCPHQGASLAEGTVHAGRVICPLHSWVFELKTGRCPRDTHEPVDAYPVRYSSDGIEVGLPAD